MLGCFASGGNDNLSLLSPLWLHDVQVDAKPPETGPLVSLIPETGKGTSLTYLLVCIVWLICYSGA